MAGKDLSLDDLDEAIRRVGAPENGKDAARLADAAAQLTATVRNWVAGGSREHPRPAVHERAPRTSQELSALAIHLRALAHQWLSLQLQVSEMAVEAGAAREPLATLRYLNGRRAFSSDTEMAETLGVHRSQITRWKQGASPDADNAERLVGFDVVVSLLEGFLELESIPTWLRGLNAHLGHRRPIDVLGEGRLSEVVRAIEAEREGAFA